MNMQSLNLLIYLPFHLNNSIFRRDNILAHQFNGPAEGIYQPVIADNAWWGT